jgi:hypothetical protein
MQSSGLAYPSEEEETIISTIIVNRQVSNACGRNFVVGYDCALRKKKEAHGRRNS